MSVMRSGRRIPAIASPDWSLRIRGLVGVSGVPAYPQEPDGYRTGTVRPRGMVPKAQWPERVRIPQASLHRPGRVRERAPHGRLSVSSRGRHPWFASMGSGHVQAQGNRWGTLGRTMPTFAPKGKPEILVCKSKFFSRMAGVCGTAARNPGSIRPNRSTSSN